MEATKRRIQRIALLLFYLARLASIVLTVLALSSLVILVILLFSKEGMQGIEMDFSTSFFRMLDRFQILTGIDPKYRSAISVFTAFGSFLIFKAYIRIFRKILEIIMEGEKPFSTKLAKRLRQSAWLMLFLLFYNPGMGIILFLVTLFFSYLVEYGAYLQDKADNTTKIQENMILSFAEISENKSGQTGQHIKRVAEYSKILALEMGYSEAEAENIRLASTMHDIGKLVVPTEIIEKPARLTDEEYAVIKTHTTYGGQLLENVEGDIMSLARTVALEHHERIDGKGYPFGKQGDEISMEGRIVAVCDVYDALTSKRSYKNAWKPEDAYDEIVKNSGTQFDEKVVEAFKRAYGQIDTVRRQFADAQ